MLMVGMILAAVVGFVLLNRWDKADSNANEYRVMEYTDARWRKLNETKAQGIEAAEIYADTRLHSLNATAARRIETAQICADARWRKLKACC